MYKKPIDVFLFGGTGNFSLTFNNAAVVDASVAGADYGLATIADTSHGRSANTLIYITGSTNYNGIRYIEAVAVSTFNIRIKKFAAETLAGTEVGRCIVTFPQRWEFVGFKLHLSTAAATSENLAINVDANAGSAFDTNIYTKDMAGVKDIVYYLEEEVLLAGDDLLVFTYTNTDARTWGLIVEARQLI